MNLEASIKRFRDELQLRTPASRDDFMCYDWAAYSQSPTNWHCGAFKSGWRAAQKALKDRRHSYRIATLQRLAWDNLGYRFVRWQDANGQEPCDRAGAYKLFKRIFVGWLAHPTKKQFIQAAEIKGPLDREYSVLGRVEQSYLRHTLFDKEERWACSLCGRHLPLGLLIAAHVKPRSKCSRRERVDVRNIVFRVCLLGCDALYERGFIGVGKRGRILTSTAQSSRAIKSVFRRFRGRTCKDWKAERAGYFNWHLTRRFQGTNGASSGDFRS